jgi:hypothetical protein
VSTCCWKTGAGTLARRRVAINLQSVTRAISAKCNETRYACTVSPFPEAWWKREFCFVLWSSVEASGFNSQKTSRPMARGVLLRHDCQTIQERIKELQWELLEYPPYSRDSDPIDLHLFGPLTDHLGGKRFADEKRLKRGCGSGWDNSQKTSVLRVSTHW